MARIFWAVLLSVLQVTTSIKTCQNEPPAVRTECNAVHAVICVYLRTHWLNMTRWESYCFRNLLPLKTNPRPHAGPYYQASTIFLWTQRCCKFIQIHFNTSRNLITVTIRTTMTHHDFLVSWSLRNTLPDVLSWGCFHVTEILDGWRSGRNKIEDDRHREKKYGNYSNSHQYGRKKKKNKDKKEFIQWETEPRTKARIQGRKEDAGN